MNTNNFIWYLPFFLPLITNLSALACFIVLLRRNKSNPGLKGFILYTGVYVLVQLFSFGLGYFGVGSAGMQSVAENLDHLLILIELLVYLFFFRTLFNKTQQRIFMGLSVCFTLFFLVQVIVSNLHDIAHHNQVTLLYIIQSVVLIVGGLFYFYNLFKRPIIKSPNQVSSFWIGFGLLFFKTGMLPFVVLETFIATHYLQYLYIMITIYGVFGSMYFLIILRAGLCKPAAETPSSFPYGPSPGLIISIQEKAAF